MKIFISQPVSGKTKEEVKCKNDSIVAMAKRRYGNDVSATSMNPEYCFDGRSRDLWMLGRAIQFLSTADVAVFANGWGEYRECRIERICAKEYGVQIIDEVELENCLRYGVEFQVKVDGTDARLPLHYCNADIGESAKRMVETATGFSEECGNKGLCKDFIPVVKQALLDVKSNSDMYRGPVEPTVSTLVGECVEFFEDILHSWGRLKLDMPEIADVAEFWIVEVEHGIYAEVMDKVDARRR